MQWKQRQKQIEMQRWWVMQKHQDRMEDVQQVTFMEGLSTSNPCEITNLAVSRVSSTSCRGRLYGIVR